ncbi:MAG: hypothetical protein LCI02_02375 [Proteobacteria bacterium]|nr:hypothetical protein [Pseudomonadota bacterium]
MPRLPVLPSLSTLAAAALLAACGGGGDSAGGGKLGLSADNYVSAGQEALAAGLQFEESTELIVGAQAVRRSDASLLNVALTALRAAAGSAPALPVTATGLVITASFNCDNAGGRYTLASDDANNNNRYDAGDTLTFTFSNCTLGGDTANGSATITIKSLSGNLNSDVYNGSFSLAMTALTLGGDSGRYTGDGQFDVTLVGTAADTGSGSISAPSFKSVAVFGNQTSSRSLSNFSVNESHVPDSGGQRSSIRFDGTLATVGFNNRSISVTTVAPFVVNGGARYPSSGQAVVSGGTAGVVRVTAIDGNTVRFELDAQGDGVYETTTTRSWSELL